MHDQAISPAVQQALRTLTQLVEPAEDGTPSLDGERRRKPYRVAEIAVALDVHMSTVYRDIEAGKLRAMRVGVGRGTLRVPVDAFEEYKTRLMTDAVTRPAGEVA